MELKELYRVVFKAKRVGPEKVMISPTDYCNLRCKICWRLEKGDYLDEPSLPEMKRWLKECKNLGVKIIDLTGGGEAFMRKDILKILKFVKKLGFYGTLTTNGTLIDEKSMKEMIRMGWDDIAFSLDGPERINDDIRGEGVFKKVISTIKIFNELKRERSTEKPIIRIATVVNRKNYKTLNRVVKLANSLGLNSIYFSTLVEWKTNKSFWIRGFEKELVKEHLKRAEVLAENYGIHTNLKSLIRHGVGAHEPPKFCFAPWLMLFINASGDAMVCCTLASLYSNVVGNAKEESIEEIWFGKKMEKFRERMKKRDFFPQCKRCIPEFVDNFNEWINGMEDATRRNR